MVSRKWSQIGGCTHRAMLKFEEIENNLSYKFIKPAGIQSRWGGGVTAQIHLCLGQNYSCTIAPTAKIGHLYRRAISWCINYTAARFNWWIYFRAIGRSSMIIAICGSIIGRWTLGWVYNRAIGICIERICHRAIWRIGTTELLCSVVSLDNSIAQAARMQTIEKKEKKQIT